jgi:hypothetical protein
MDREAKLVEAKKAFGVPTLQLRKLRLSEKLNL